MAELLHASRRPAAELSGSLCCRLHGAHGGCSYASLLQGVQPIDSRATRRADLSAQLSWMLPRITQHSPSTLTEDTVTNMKRESRGRKPRERETETDQDGLGRDAVGQGTWHSHFNSSLCQSFGKQVHLWRAAQLTGGGIRKCIYNFPELSHFATYKGDATATHSSVDVDPRLRSLLYQAAVVQQGAEQSAILRLCVGSTCKQQSPFLNQTG